MLRERFALVIHENKNAKKIYIMKPDLKHIGLCEPRILEFEFNSLYVRAFPWHHDSKKKKKNNYLCLSFQGYPEIYPVGLKFVTVSDFEKTIENNKMP